MMGRWTGQKGTQERYGKYSREMILLFSPRFLLAIVFVGRRTIAGKVRLENKQKMMRAKNRLVRHCRRINRLSLGKNRKRVSHGEKKTWGEKPLIGSTELCTTAFSHKEHLSSDHAGGTKSREEGMSQQSRFWVQCSDHEGCRYKKGSKNVAKEEVWGGKLL